MCQGICWQLYLDILPSGKGRHTQAVWSACLEISNEIRREEHSLPHRNVIVGDIYRCRFIPVPYAFVLIVLVIGAKETFGEF